MISLFRRVLTAGLVSGIIIAALPFPSLAADGVTAFAPEHELTLALEQGDARAVGALLENRFQWVDVNGVVHTKAETLANLGAFAASNRGVESPSELVARDYGRVNVLRGIHGSQKFGHVWVKAPEGWRAFVYVDTAVRGEPRVFKPQPPRGTGTCENRAARSL